MDAGVVQAAAALLPHRAEALNARLEAGLAGGDALHDGGRALEVVPHEAAMVLGRGLEERAQGLLGREARRGVGGLLGAVLEEAEEHLGMLGAQLLDVELRPFRSRGDERESEDEKSESDEKRRELHLRSLA